MRSLVNAITDGLVSERIHSTLLRFFNEHIIEEPFLHFTPCPIRRTAMSEIPIRSSKSFIFTLFWIRSNLFIIADLLHLIGGHKYHCRLLPTFKMVSKAEGPGTFVIPGPSRSLTNR